MLTYLFPELRTPLWHFILMGRKWDHCNLLSEIIFWCQPCAKCCWASCWLLVQPAVCSLQTGCCSQGPLQVGEAFHPHSKYTVNPKQTRFVELVQPEALCSLLIGEGHQKQKVRQPSGSSPVATEMEYYLSCWRQPFYVGAKAAPQTIPKSHISKSQEFLVLHLEHVMCCLKFKS